MTTTQYVIIWLAAGIVGDLLTYTDKQTRDAFKYTWPWHILLVLSGVLGFALSASFLIYNDNDSDHV